MFGNATVQGWNSKKTIVVVGLALVVLLSSMLAFVGTNAPASSSAPVSSPGAPAPPTSPVAPSTGTGASSAPATTDSAFVQSEETARATLVNSARQAFLNNGVSLNDFLPPTLNVPQKPVTQTDNHIDPLYYYAAAPIGVSTFGLENTTGTTTPYILNTTSLLGTVTTTDPEGIQAISPYYGTLQAYGDQLNTVLNNTTLFGQGGYDFWLQNVIQYTDSSNTLSFVLNIWNFSSPSGIFPSSSILHGQGRIEEEEVYETSGPSITVAYPYTLDLYLNTTVGSYDGSPMVNEVYFNYTVINSAGQVVCPTTEPSGDVCGEYDNVYFNSGVNVAPGSAEISANGYEYTPLGLPSDMEMDVGIGQSDGANANIVYANANVGLYTLAPGTTDTYVAPPSAYDFGSETGETGQGALTTWNEVGGQPVAYYRTGPSLLQGLWGVNGGTDGAPSIGAGSEGSFALNYADVAPGNAFLAIAPGTAQTNESLFQVAPTFGWFTGKGQIGQNIWLSAGAYTVQVMLSGYNEQTVNVNLATSGQSLVVTLARSATPTVYTPLWAFSNSDLANLSTFGAGTPSNPYILLGNQKTSLSPVFGILNDYLFIVYSGIWINATTANFEFNPPPTLEITEPSWWYFQTDILAAAYGGTLDYNSLPMYFYHTTNMVVEHGTSIGIWSSDIEVGHDYSIYCNVCTNDVFASNTFNVSSEGLEFLGTGVAPNSGIGHNYVWGNTFAPFSLPGEDTGSPAEAYGGMSLPSTGLAVDSSGNWIYNNAFYTNGTASSTSRATGVTYSNFWNATGGYQPATNAIVANGIVLSGSILGQSYQGGNYWFNYGTVADPYGVPYNARASSPTGTASISGLGDLAPLSPYVTQVVSGTVVPAGIVSGLYPVTFTESGLPSGTSWTVHLNGVPVYEPLTFSTATTNPSNTTKVTTAVLWAPNGTYSFTAGVPTGYAPTPLTGTVTVSGSPTGASIAYTAAAASISPVSGPAGTAVTLTATGLSDSTAYTLHLDSKQGTALTTALSFTTTGSGGYTGTFPVPAIAAGSYYADVFEGTVYILSTTSKLTVTTPSVSLAPTQGPIGASAAITASGLASIDSYAVFFDVTAGVLGTYVTYCTTSSSGTLTGSGGSAPCMLSVPSVASGTYHVDLYELSSEDYIAGASTQSFTVTSLSLTVSPSQGPVGAPVTISGSGFSTDAALASLTFDGVAITSCSSGSLTTGATGAFSCSTSVPSGTSGTTVTASDVGGQSAFTTFTVTVPAIVLTPSQGPPGATVTVSGSGYTVSGSVLLYFAGSGYGPTGCSDGTLAYPYIIADTSGNFVCTFSVPNVSPTSYAVSAVDLTTGASPSQTFTVTALAITVTPGQGPVGASVTVAGTGYSVSTPLAALVFDGVSIGGCTSGSLMANGAGAFSCTFAVPSGTSGTAVIAADVGTFYASGTFTVTTPSITVKPKQGPIGAPVTVKGSGFSVSSAVDLVFDGVSIAGCTGGSLTTGAGGAFSCTFAVPSGTSGTSVTATDVGGAVASGKFTVTTPKITVSPKKGPVGATVTITGTGFTVSSTATLVFDGVTIASCSVGGGLTTGTTGQFSCTTTVPTGTSGTTVAATDAYGRVATAKFTVTTPHITVSPKSGVAGTTVTITGTGFSESTTLRSLVFDNVVITSCTSGSLTTTATGTFSCTISVPSGTSGTSVIATDVGGAYATATFRVT